jgi:hypothetical protein
MCQVVVLPDEYQPKIGQDKNVVPHSVNHEKGEVISLAEEAARLCALEQSEGTKGGKKHKKEKMIQT